jgi:glycerol kinase
MAFVLAIDQGTTNSKALLLDAAGNVAARASAPVAVAYPQPGWVEQSPADLWQSVLTVARQCLAAAGSEPVAAIGISNQRESVLVWERATGAAIGPCITWQCRRSADRLKPLRTPEFESRVRATTGLGLDPLFPAAKLGWLLDACPEARRLAAAGGLCAGTVDSWLVFNFTGGTVHATDFGNAARTQLFDIAGGAWSEDLATTFGVPTAILPAALASDGDFGVTAAGCGLPAGLPIRAVMGDSHAALFGHGIRAPGPVKATYGTGSSLMTLTNGPTPSANGLSTTIAWRRGATTAYALEGNITVSAQAAAWCSAILGLADAAALTDLAATVPDNGGVAFVPALAGLGAPHWRDDARALFTGMSLGTTRAHLARATLEAIALQVGDVFAAMERDTGAPLAALSVDGGATANDLLMQIQADVLARPVERPALPELSALGAGLMAGAAAGLWDADARLTLNARRDVLRPRMDEAERARLLEGWALALRRATL